MEMTGWMMCFAQFAVIIIAITTTTVYAEYDNSVRNSTRSMLAHDLDGGVLYKTENGEVPGVFRFGKRFDSEFYPMYKKDIPGVLRFGKRDDDIPGVLRFGKRDEYIPGVLRFGKRTDVPGVLRFGRSVPGVLRFGRR